MLIPNRHGSTDSYRYGFQGQEKDDEIKGEGNSINYKFRMHDPRVGRFFAVDPLTKKYPHYSPYSFSGNKVIQFVELEGLEEGFPDYMQPTEADRQKVHHAHATAVFLVETAETTISGATFIATTIFGGIAAVIDENVSGKKKDWHKKVQHKFSFDDGMVQAGYNSGLGNLTPEEGIEMAEGVLSLYAAIEIGQLRGAIKRILTSKTNKTISLIGNSADIDEIAKLTTVVKNNANPNGFSRLSNDEAWVGLLEKYKHIADDSKRWQAINDDWWDNFNKPWLDEIIERGDEIGIASDPTDDWLLFNFDGTKRHFKREIEYLESKGYVRDGDKYVKKQE